MQKEFNEINLNDLENNLSKEYIIQKLDSNIISIIKHYKYVSYILLLLFITYFIIKVTQSNKFYSKSTEEFEDFQIIMKSITHLFKNYDNIMTFLILPRFGNKEVLESLIETKKEDLNQLKELTKNRLKNYQNIYNLFKNLDHNNEELPYILCNLDPLQNTTTNICFEIYNSNCTLFEEGFTVAIEAMSQTIDNVYSDYKGYKNNILTKEDIINEFIDSNFYKLSISVNFIIIYTQDNLYNNYFKDHNIEFQKIEKKIIILNFVYIVLCTILGLFIIFFVVFNVKSLFDNINESNKRIYESINLFFNEIP